jgi:carboxypeptidase Taq
MGQNLDRLKERLGQVTHLNHAAALLNWDQTTYMPPGGAAARGEQLATLTGIAHEMSVSDELGELLQNAAKEVANLPRESDDASLVRVAKKDYEDNRKLPPSLVAEVARHGAAAYGVWAQAREQNDFGTFAPYLEKTIDYSRQIAELLGYEDQLYDALLDQFEPGMKTVQVQAIFEQLKAELVPLVHAIAERVDQVDDSMLHRSFDEAKQEEFGKLAATAFGYDFMRGRQDRTVHPFCTSFSVNDVRITTRFDPDWLNPALFSTLHEAGHAMYEQGVSQSLEGSPLGGGASLGLHESQSRMWENVVGRSRGFWHHYYPKLQKVFPQLGDTDGDTFYRAVNRVEPSAIRVEADEATYNMHIMLRLEMELALLSGDMKVADAPAAWNEKMRSYLGVTPETDALGILQDVHWSHGVMGYFTTYSLGNLLSVQLYDAALRDHPEIPDEIGRGEFGTLREWMADRVYRHGRKFQPNELVPMATGQPITPAPYIAYLKQKFGDIYDL